MNQFIVLCLFVYFNTSKPEILGCRINGQFHKLPPPFTRVTYGAHHSIRSRLTRWPEALSNSQLFIFCNQFWFSVWVPALFSLTYLITNMFSRVKGVSHTISDRPMIRMTDRLIVKMCSLTIGQRLDDNKRGIQKVRFVMGRDWERKNAVISTWSRTSWFMIYNNQFKSEWIWSLYRIYLNHISFYQDYVV